MTTKDTMRKFTIRRITRSALLFAAGVCVCVGLFGLIEQSTFLFSAVRVKGTVISVIPRGETFYPVVAYIDHLGTPQQYSYSPNTVFHFLREGEKVDVLYDPRSPAAVRFARFSWMWMVTVGWFVVGLLCVVFWKLLSDSSRGTGEVKHTGGIWKTVSTDSVVATRPVIRPKSLESSAEASSATDAAKAPPAPRKKESPKKDTKRGAKAKDVERLESNAPTFGILQPLVDDSRISDIIVAGYSEVTVKRGGRVVATGIRFQDVESYEAFVDRLLMKANASYSTAKPIVDGVIGSTIRLHAVNSVLCEAGPYLTIRVSRFQSVTDRDLVRHEIAPPVVFDYLKAMMWAGQTLLVGGEVGAGKTTLARALACTIAENESILVIEDTPEIKIAHPHVRYVHTREANMAGVGRIPLSQCIRAGMRMAMNRIILGEIRDAEAAEAFVDVCVSGHPGISTIHARSSVDAAHRLELFLGRMQKGVSRQVIREQIATALQAVVFLKLCPVTGKRRIEEIQELQPSGDDGVRWQTIFRYGIFDDVPGWKVVSRESFFEQAIAPHWKGPALLKLPEVFGLDPSTYRERAA